MIGRPVAGLRMLFVDIIKTRASICASTESGTCTAIWSPSKSALKALQTNGMELDRLAIDQHRLEGLHAQAVQGRRPVQRITGCSWMTSARMSQTSSRSLFHHLLRSLDGGDVSSLLELRVDERLEQLQRHARGQTALMEPELGARQRSPNDRSSRPACREGSGGSARTCPSACRRATSAVACSGP